MLTVTDLTKTYDAFRLGPLDLQVDEEVLAVLGPSGCGKTTFLSLLAGITTADRGSVTLGTQCLDDAPPEERSMGLVFQDGALFPHMTARENVAYAAAAPERVESLADRFEIRDVLDQSAATLSGGERQRVALARALAADPDALLLDEPLTNLDAPIRRRLRDEFHGLFDSLGIPVLYVTHDQRAATALGDRIAVLRDGQLEQLGTPEEILERPATAFVASFTGSENLLDAEVVAREDDHLILQAGTVKLRATGDAPVGATVTAAVRPARVQLADRAALGDGGNVLTGTIRRWINEGDVFRFAFDVPDVDEPVNATVPTIDFQGDAPGSGDSIRVAIPPDAIHVIDGE